MTPIHPSHEFQVLMDTADKTRAVLVWRAKDAPAWFNQFGSPDNREYVAYVPDSAVMRSWMNEVEPFELCRTESFVWARGTIYVGYHA